MVESTAEGAKAEPRLIPTMGPTMLALYGLGSMLGAGIYGLVGRAAGVMGAAVWAAFLVAMAAALMTGLSYAALGARYPRAGGAAYIIDRAFKRRMLSYCVGLAVVASGLASMATGSRVVAENIEKLFGIEGLSPGIIAAIYLALLCALVWRGLKESMWFNALATVIEAGGLLLVIAVGARFWGSADLLETPTAGDWGATLLMLAQGAVLTFFAFLGFEDTLNVAEEVKNPRRTLPIGLIVAMSAATLIYLAVAVTAVSVVPWRELAEAPAPLGLVMERAAPQIPAIAYVVITIFAVANTALINFVMGSRLVFGMAREGLLPGALARLHPTQNTPHYAATAIFVVATLLALAGDVSQLAAATVLLLLGVFILMNLALIVLRRRPGEPTGGFEPPLIVPILGMAICAVLLVVRAATGDLRATLIAGGLIVAIAGLYFVARPSMNGALKGTKP